MTDQPFQPLRSFAELFICVDDCPVCLGTGHVCESHPDKPWEGYLADDDKRACRCGAPGMPCPRIEQ